MLTATGRHFCTGADLRASTAPAPGPRGRPSASPATWPASSREGAQRLIGAVLDCEKPVIAAVNGTAAGIGAHLALACDLVLAAEGARFIEVFVRRGLVPDGGGAWLLPRLVGLQRAKELMFFGDDLAAADAERLGLVNRVVPADDLQAGGRRVGRPPGRRPHPGARPPPRGWSTARSTPTGPRPSARRRLAQELNMTTRDAQEGVAAFVERREPDFLGW